MSLDLSAVSAAIGTMLGTIGAPNLAVYVGPPINVQLPAVAAMAGDITFNVSMGGVSGLTLVEFELTFLTQATDLLGAYEYLNAIRNPSGAGSLRAAWLADRTLGGTADVSRLASYSEIIGLEYDSKSLMGFGATMEVWGT